MKRTLLLGLATLLATSCTRSDRQNSMFCGLLMQEAGYKILDQFPRGHSLLTSAPPELLGDRIPTRSMGHPTGYSVGTPGDTGQVVLNFAGEGLPGLPGLAVALLDDSSEVFRGVAIFETQPGRGFPQLGTIVGDGATIPLYGMRIYWPGISNDDCPLFAPQDSLQPVKEPREASETPGM